MCQTYRLADHSPGSTASAGSTRERTAPKTATLRTHCPTRCSYLDSSQSNADSGHVPLGAALLAPVARDPPGSSVHDRSAFPPAGVAHVPGRAHVASVHVEVHARVSPTLLGRGQRVTPGPIGGLGRSVGAPVRAKARRADLGRRPSGRAGGVSAGHRTIVAVRRSSAGESAGVQAVPARSGFDGGGIRGRTRRAETCSTLRRRLGPPFVHPPLQRLDTLGTPHQPRRATGPGGRPAAIWSGDGGSATMGRWQRP